MARPIASRRLLRRLLVVAVFVAGSFASVRVNAQTPADSQRAQLLFDEARSLMNEGRFSEACAKFAESQTLDPGGGTILNLGICRKQEGRTATAFRVLTDALAQARAGGRQDRIATAERHLAELEPVLSRLTVRLPSAELAPDLVLELDGERLLPDALGRPFPVDPGSHELRATRPGYLPWAVHVELGPKADSRTVDVPALVPEATPLAPVAAVPAAVASQPKPAAPPAEPAPQAPKRSNTVGYALVGAGGALVVVGGIFGARALSLKAESDRYYQDGFCTQQSCVDDWDDAKTAATLSNIGIGLGVATLGVGVYLLLRPSPKARPSERVSLSLQPLRGGAGAVMGGEF